MIPDPNPGALNPGVKRREVFAWAMYDFANSGYTTVVLTAVFNAYFVSVIAGNAPWATFLWTATLAVSYALVMIAGPLIGAYADVSGKKKPLLFIVTVGCIVSTALLVFSGPGTLLWAMVFIIISNFCYALGENLVAAFLPELARPEALGKVSGWGWSLGYVGGLAMLVMAWFATTPPLFWVAANLAGLCMGSSQSAGRTLVAFFAPPARTAEMFGLFGVATRLAAILGPLTYGAVTWISDGNHRLAILLTGAFFIAALFILASVNESRGRQAALSSGAGD